MMSYIDQMINVNLKPTEIDNQRLNTENAGHFCFINIVLDYSVIVRIY